MPHAILLRVTRCALTMGSGPSSAAWCGWPCGSERALALPLRALGDIVPAARSSSAVANGAAESLTPAELTQATRLYERIASVGLHATPAVRQAALPQRTADEDVMVLDADSDSDGCAPVEPRHPKTFPRPSGEVREDKWQAGRAVGAVGEIDGPTPSRSANMPRSAQSPGVCAQPCWCDGVGGGCSDSGRPSGLENSGVRGSASAIERDSSTASMHRAPCSVQHATHDAQHATGRRSERDSSMESQPRDDREPPMHTTSSEASRLRPSADAEQLASADPSPVDGTLPEGVMPKPRFTPTIPLPRQHSGLGQSAALASSDPMVPFVRSRPERAAIGFAAALRPSSASAVRRSTSLPFASLGRRLSSGRGGAAASVDGNFHADQQLGTAPSGQADSSKQSR